MPVFSKKSFNLTPAHIPQGQLLKLPFLGLFLEKRLMKRCLVSSLSFNSNHHQQQTLTVRDRFLFSGFLSSQLEKTWHEGICLFVLSSAVIVTFSDGFCTLSCRQMRTLAISQTCGSQQMVGLSFFFSFQQRHTRYKSTLK